MSYSKYIVLYENENFIVEYDQYNHQYRVSYFEDNHFKADCFFGKPISKVKTLEIGKKMTRKERQNEIK